MRPDTVDRDERQAVLRALDLPSISPAIDHTPTSIARRTGLAAGRVASILQELAVERTTLVREVGTGFWLRNPQGRGAGQR